MTTFQDAAASYFGLAETGVRKTEVFTHEGDMIVVFEVPLTSEDVLGIADRMRVLQTDQAAPQATIEEPVSREAMRAAYNALAPTERSAYGSFARYMALGGGADPYAQVGGERDRGGADPEAASVLPGVFEEQAMSTDHAPVPIQGDQCSDEQKACALDYDDDTYQYLVPWCMLTEAQRNAIDSQQNKTL